MNTNSVCGAEIHYRNTGRSSNVTATHMLLSHLGVCGWSNSTFPPSGPCQSSLNLSTTRSSKVWEKI